ncbi:LptF/LptG family permease [Pelagicoccus sp. NFK12]|uniref:LptF/LptG family permease n=1 Tax=Pelagicoccus enzymogenes TaxID=2773457 RepID=A0A927F9U5_9BACT|nr:LptF/LptG family permease [Pelagicoccus enzymogenes]MBD5780499.1 LptF/LptG family permease [Pelagicoccus enzymogenes]MDQ8197601.1 LptF/LptG family permease [Pelagicoccus enzymogenes]
MSLIHRYIFKNVFASCLASVAMFAFLILTMSMVKDMLNLLAEGQLTLRAFFRLTWQLLPFVFVYALPMGFITGALLTMGRLSAENEITSLRAAGVSVIRLSSSVFLLAILGTTASLVVNFYYGPLAKTQYRQELKDVIQTNPLGFIVEKTFVRDFTDTVIYVGKKDGEMLYDVWIWKLNEASQVTLFARAEKGRFAFLEGSSELQLDTEQTIVEYRDKEDPESFRTKKFYPLSMERVPFMFPMSEIIGEETLARKLTWMTFDELQAEVTRYEGIADTSSGEVREEALENLLKAKMVFHKNFAMGFAVLSFACIAVPLGLKTSRKETSANLGLGVGMGLLYYLAMISIGWLDGKPELRPELLFWIPNLAYQGLGAWLFIRADHGRKAKK